MLAGGRFGRRLDRIRLGPRPDPKNGDAVSLFERTDGGEGHVARGETRSPDGAGKSGKVHEDVRLRRDRDHVGLNRHVNIFDARLASKGVLDALGSRPSLDAVGHNPDPT